VSLQKRKIEVSATKILVVDDSLPWRYYLLKYFETQAEFKVITVAVDGFKAVQIASELRPDVVLMDIGLPGMNGIEATRQIRMVSPDSKILFLSILGDSEFIQAAFDAGGSGYVLKLDSGRDLVPGIRAVLLGHQFVSHSLTGCHACSNAG
jgi:DNA-binding NarL/FixJ family response regulator